MNQRELTRTPSKALGNTTEIAVLAPIRLGRVPGERRTFEERLEFVIRNIQNRAERGIPTLLNQIQTIHFGRLIILRPEHYLHYSDVPGVAYLETETGKIPAPIDAFRETLLGMPGGAAGAPPEAPVQPPVLRSYLMTLVTFDGDLKVYFRDIADLLKQDFDRVFENCEDYGGTSNFEVFWSWIRRYQISVNLFHSAYPDLTVVEIKRLQYFKRRFDEFVARVRKPGGQNDTDINELFDDFLRETQQFESGFPSHGGVFQGDPE